MQPIESDFTRLEVAKLLNVGLVKVDDMIRTGALPSYKLGTGRRSARRIPRAALEAIRAGQTPPASTPFRVGGAA